MRTALPLLAAIACGSPAQPERVGSQPPAPGTAGCRLARGQVTPPVWQDGGGRAEVTVAGRPCARRFSLATTAPLVESSPDSPRRFAERGDRPVVRTGNDLFDALYALAHVEAVEASVDRIRDGSFDRGAPLECPPGGCYETGKLWTYVWTRDTAYSMDLGLAAFDVRRARNSLEFKLSERREGGDLQIVQDTGSGGSYPISTDRVAWALGAERLLHFLDGEERDAFAARALEAIGNTIEHDRAVVFDEEVGLYRGETSFLDWREQTYPAWTARDTVEVGMSHAVSTNAVHLRALEIAADLAAERGQAERATRWRGWAEELRANMTRRFWLIGVSSYALDTVLVERFDLLGTSLAVLNGVVTGVDAAKLLDAYPRLPYGPPVVWPFDAEAAIYHNRAVWPFVTAYALRAARLVGDAEVASDGALSMVRGAALHLSHMENFEAVTGRAFVSDGPRSGPVVNSPRQLWSVAGYLSMVQELVFGLETTRDGIRFRPFLPYELRRRLFAGSETLVLDRFPYRGTRFTVVLSLPSAKEGPGAYAIGRILLNGRAAPDRFWRREELERDNLVEIQLVEGAPTGIAAHPPLTDTGNRGKLFAPPPPVIRSLEAKGDRMQLAIEGPPGAAIAVYRDQQLLIQALPPGTRSWTDPDAGSSGAGHCYALAAIDQASGLISHRSPRRCWDGRHGERRRHIRATGGAFSVRIAEPGLYQWRIHYRNPGPFNTGITCAVKRIVIAGEGGKPLAAGYLMMPHTGDTGRESRASSWLTTHIERPGSYRIRLVDDARSINMSAFRHFERYTGGAGGHSGPRNQVEVVELEVYARSGRVYLPAGARRASHVDRRGHR